MTYTLMFYESQEDFAARIDPARKEAYLAGWTHYVRAIQEAGIGVFGSGLYGPESAATMKRRGGEVAVQDGPFPETKEQLGGIYVINVPDLDTALEWAARAPVETVEVRQNIPAL
ncbi:YCII-related protein [Paenibacillus curdlanolyticus YK9]|uniref:YCII-related protein n=1 Tax=Paenibacillus curdlanolyticus YK9 TaxID=717606 RepID=E0I9J9_9BACL|nr:YciI family protein [Paenibacillus curdlanolyticus]EFM11083.1 YCII-related protein [Paenibacillus curdlanolyticus YK9]